MISTGEQDAKGIDFILKTKSNDFPIDVTINPDEYTRKLKNKNSISILLPIVDPDTESTYLKYFKHTLLQNDFEYFLEKTFLLNTYVINNLNKNFKVYIKEERGKVRHTSKRHKKAMLTFEFPGIKKKYKVTITPEKIQSIFNTLSIIKNPNP